MTNDLDAWAMPDDPPGLGGETAAIPAPADLTTENVQWYNGPGGQPCPGYVPSRYELAVLVKHYARLRFDIQAFETLYKQTGSVDRRLWHYASGALGEAMEHLGTDIVRALIAETEDEGLAALSERARDAVQFVWSGEQRDAEAAGEAWARNPANTADLPRVGAAREWDEGVCNTEEGETLFCDALRAGAVPETEWLLALASGTAPRPITARSPDRDLLFAVYFVRGARRAQPEPPPA